MEEVENRYALAYKQIAKIINSPLQIRKQINSIAASATKGLQASGCSIMLLNPQRQYLDIAGSFGLSDTYLRKGPINARKSYPDILDGKIVAIEDIATDKRTQYPQAARMENLKSLLGAPIRQRDEIIGEIRIYSHERRHFKPHEKDFIATVANFIAVLLEKNELHQYLSDKHESLQAQQKKLTSFSKIGRAHV